MSFIRAVVVDPDVPGQFVIKEVEALQSGPSEALVQVEAFSLNRGDAIILVKEGWIKSGWTTWLGFGRNRHQASCRWDGAEGWEPGDGSGECRRVG